MTARTTDATVHLARLLHAAALAEDEGDEEGYKDGIRAAAEMLCRIYEHIPQSLPRIFETLALASPIVRPGDLAAAADWAADGAAEVIGHHPAVLHPQCPVWIALACATHEGADPERVAAAVSLLPTERGFVRSGGLPLTDELRELSGACMIADLNACADVHLHHGDAMSQRAGVTAELLRILEGAGFAEGGTVGDAVDRLSGADRVRAEEVLAGLPALLNVGRGSGA